MSLDLIQALSVSREAERDQALFYRALAAEAEERGDAALSERFNELHADEQHHVSRLTARLLELGAKVPELPKPVSDPVSLDQWERHARRRERDEVKRYELLLAHDLDSMTAGLIERIVEVERHHEQELGGKWTPA
jgi:rubrerythrin